MLAEQQPDGARTEAVDRRQDGPRVALRDGVAQLASRPTAGPPGTRKRAASSRCSWRTVGEASRSAIVRATRRSRPTPRADSPVANAIEATSSSSAGRRRQAARSRAPSEPRVRTPSTCQRHGPGGGDPTRHHCARLRPGRTDELGRGDPRHLYPQVDPVAERTGDTTGVALRDARRTAAAGVGTRGPATRTGVHRRHELEAGGQCQRPADPHDRDPAILERLTERLEDIPAEFRQLVQEQDAVVGPGDLAGRQPRSSADHPRVDDRVMRSTERARRTSSVNGPSPATDAMVVATRASASLERREQPGDRSSEHGLAGPRRTGEQQSVAAGQGDLERAPADRLTTDVGEVGRLGTRVRRRRRPAWPCSPAPPAIAWPSIAGQLDPLGWRRPVPPRRDPASRRSSTTWPRSDAGRASTSGARPASAAASDGTTIRRDPRSASAATIGNMPGTARRSPPSDSSPMNAHRPARPGPGPSRAGCRWRWPGRARHPPCADRPARG